MIQDSDTQVVKDTIDDAFLNEDILLSMGFVFRGAYKDTYNTRAYTYEKENLGRFEVFIQDIKCYNIKNNILPKTDIVVVSNITHYPTNDGSTTQKICQRYLLRVRDLKELIEFKRLTAKIADLQQQAEDMLGHSSMRTLRELEMDVSGFD